MSLQYIIDAYNIINHPQFRPRIRKSPNIQTSLADFIRLNRLSGSRKNRVILVFDGYPPYGEKMPEEDGLVCVFSRMIEADELIKKLVEESGRPRNIIVVSDDKAVQLAVRFLNSRVCAVEEFICGKKSARTLDFMHQEREENKITYSKMQVINAELKKKWLE
ncbi:MAG: NYN domain-containing protein [Candidatus Omnitrophica bacterium]|nr:NYN domain-containing protein [Candidatus Omnitrophota bacterium]MBU1922995.1 NYN domain-containing protein [Candidatus Omnitrophota bacterium]